MTVAKSLMHILVSLSLICSGMCLSAHPAGASDTAGYAAAETATIRQLAVVAQSDSVAPVVAKPARQRQSVRQQAQRQGRKGERAGRRLSPLWAYGTAEMFFVAPGVRAARILHADESGGIHNKYKAFISFVQTVL